MERDETEMESGTQQFGEVELILRGAKEEALREIWEELLGRFDFEQSDRAGVLDLDLGFAKAVPRNPDQVEGPAETLVDTESLEDSLAAFGVRDEEVLPLRQKAALPGLQRRTPLNSLIPKRLRRQRRRRCRRKLLFPPVLLQTPKPLSRRQPRIIHFRKRYRLRSAPSRDSDLHDVK